jgi:hypothetical protein
MGARRARRPCFNRPMRHAVFTATMMSLVMLGARTAVAATFFVDAEAGDDDAVGTSEATAWRTIDRVNGINLEPGDTVSFKRGQTFAGQLHVRDDGEPADPIRIGAYGAGARPIIDAGGGDEYSTCVWLDYADHVVIADLLLRNAHYAGVYIDGATGVEVRGNEMTDVGIGVSLLGDGNLVTGNEMHDLHMVVDTPGGDDDYGANGVVVGTSDNEISYNQMRNCVAPSNDYGVDGGAIEFYGDVARNLVHHNQAFDSEGFLEIGGQAGDVNADNVVAYNLIVDTNGFGYFHIGGASPFTVELSNLRIEHNTIVMQDDASYVFGFSDVPEADDVLIRNNVVVSDDAPIAQRAGFTHDHNLFWRQDDGALGLEPDASDVVGDVGFVDDASGDYHLRADSPGVDHGADLGYEVDLDGRLVPSGAGPDCGAYEYVDPLIGDDLSFGGDGDGDGDGDGVGCCQTGAPGGGAPSLLLALVVVAGVGRRRRA